MKRTFRFPGDLVDMKNDIRSIKEMVTTLTIKEVPEDDDCGNIWTVAEKTFGSKAVLVSVSPTEHMWIDYRGSNRYFDIQFSSREEAIKYILSLKPDAKGKFEETWEVKTTGRIEDIM